MKLFEKKRTVLLLALVIYVAISLWRFYGFQTCDYMRLELPMTYSGSNDYYEDEATGYVVGVDPYSVFTVNSVDVYGCFVEIESEENKPVNVEIFWASQGESISPERRITATIQTNIKNYIWLPVDDLGVLRVDYLGSVGDMITIEEPEVVENNVYSVLIHCLSKKNIVLGLGVFTLLCIMRLCIKNTEYILNFYNEKLKKYVDKYFYLIVVAVICLFTSFMFKEYLFGEQRFIFYDIGSDSRNQTYPYLLNYASRIENGDWGSIFNFSEGVGNKNSSIVIGLSNWVALFGKENVAYLMGVSQWIKVTCACLAAFMWAELYCGKKISNLIFAFAYGFNAQFIIRGAWSSYPNIALKLIVWMIAYELSRRKKGYWFLAWATFLFFYDNSVYDCVLWAAVLLVYILFRHFSEFVENKVSLKELFLQVATYIIVMIFSCADTILGQLQAVLTSNRFTQSVSSYSMEGYKDVFTDVNTLIVGFLRTVGNDIPGINNNFAGTNFLEGPAFYCGILVFISIPVAIYNMEKIKKIWYCIGYVAVAIYILVQPVRNLANGFAGLTFKLSSAWIIILMLLTAFEFWKKLYIGEIRKYSCHFVNVTSVISIFLMIYAYKVNLVYYHDTWIVSMIMIILYTVMLNLVMLKVKLRAVGIILMMILVCLEINLLSSRVITERTVVLESELQGKAHYNDYTLDAIAQIEKDDDSWYRIDKKYHSVSLCDSLAQGYNGIESYVGGTEIGAGVLDFYSSYDLLKNGNHYLYGTGENIYANSVLGIKYVFTKSDSLCMYGYTFLEKVGDVNIYINEHALPIGYVYENSISYKIFEQYDSLERNKLLSKVVVADVNVNIDSDQEVKFTEVETLSCSYQNEEGNYILGDEKNEGDLYIIESSLNGIKGYGTVSYSTEEGTTNSIMFSYGKPIEIYEENHIARIWFDSNSQEKIDSLSIRIADANDYYKEFVDNVADLRENAMNVTEFSTNYIAGNITSETAGIFATSIPYDENWSIYIDGDLVELQYVNNGFIGAEISKGLHEITIVYNADSWLSENTFKVTIFIFLLGGTILTSIYNRRKKGSVNL